ncbi:MAG: geranylgeranyl reductase family protein [candidate division Zixibacteria bacterium]|nr:geranylgeranyl reductase family protein [candidate division Zixibacteria bacterium]
MLWRKPMKNKHDVVVIGAGPSGSTAARFASEGGCDVLLIERKRDIGIPVRCAEGVSEEPLKEFIQPHPSFIRNYIREIRLFPPNDIYVLLAPVNKGYILDRRVFDRELAKLAVRAGTDLKTSCMGQSAKRCDDGTVNVSMLFKGEKISVNCKIIIGADGVESRVGRWLGLKTVTALRNTEGALQYVLTHPEIDKRYCDFYFGKDVAPGGYLWVFPGDDNVASVGLGCAGNAIKGKTLRVLLDTFVESKYPGAKILSEVAGGIPVQATLKEITIDNMMLSGDAARQVNPMTGAGIINGMIGGKLAGQTAAEAIKKGDWTKEGLKDYPAMWHERIGKDHERFYKIKEVVNKFSDDTFNKISDSMNSLPGEDRTLKRVFMTALVKHPSLLMELRHLL